eukprot:1896641-Amphidinium_carterae.1
MSMNSFTGALAESSFQVMRTIIALFVHSNRFAGTLPNVFTWLEFLSVSNNDFEGKMLKPNVGILL